MSRSPKNAKIAAGCWTIFGVVGLLQYGYYIITTPGAFDKMISTPIVNSIPVLFIISIAANIHAALSENDED